MNFSKRHKDISASILTLVIFVLVASEITYRFPDNKVLFYTLVFIAAILAVLLFNHFNRKEEKVDPMDEIDNLGKK